jgi:hypothetical protein
VQALLKKATQAERNLQNKIKLASQSKNTSMISEVARGKPQMPAKGIS